MQKQVMRPFLVLLLLAGMLGAQAQTVWNKTYVEDRLAMYFGSVLSLDTSYLVTGLTYGAIPNLQKSIVGNIDLSGAMTRYKIVVDSNPDSYSTFSNALIKSSNGKIAFTGKTYDSVPNIILGLSNMALDSISIFKYYTPQTYGCNGYALLQDGAYYYITGIRLPNQGFTSDVVFLKIDSDGNRIWEKYYNQYVRDEAVSIIKLNNGNLMLGAGRSDLNQTHMHSNSWLIEVDTGGQVIRQWIDPNDSSYLAYGLLQTKDGGFIYGSQKYHSQPGGSFLYTGMIEKLDSNFHKQWTFNDGRHHYLTGIYDMVELSDGSFVGCGNKPTYNGDSSVISGWVVKLSSTGQVIWNRVYRGIDSTHTKNYLNDIDVLPDGSFVAVGYCLYNGHTPPEVGWMLKLDSNGCEMESCLTTDVPDFGMGPDASGANFGLNPNPASNSVTVSIDETLLGSVLMITDIMGKTMASVKVLNSAFSIPTSAFTSGVYLVTLETDKGRMTKKLAVQQ